MAGHYADVDLMEGAWTGARMIWSQWEGCLTSPVCDEFRGKLAALGVALEAVHTSGHASIVDFKQSAEALVPVHTFAAIDMRSCSTRTYAGGRTVMVGGLMTSDINQGLKHIKTRVQRGKDWRARLNHHKELAANLRYVRILGSGFRAISIDDDNPCGSLVGFNGQKIPFRKDFDLAMQDAMSPLNFVERSRAKKPEQRIQASLIRAALQNDLRFGNVMPGLHESFDDLIFITDEFAIKTGDKDVQCRADIIAIGRPRSSQIFSLVFIELKIGRELTTLLRQLSYADNLLGRSASIQHSLKEFLSAVSGIETEKIDLTAGSSKKILIWPKLKGGRERREVEVARTEGFLIVEFGSDYVDVLEQAAGSFRRSQSGQQSMKDRTSV